MLEHPKALSTHLILNNYKIGSKNLKDVKMGNQQETKNINFNNKKKILRI
jgi:hypothetical protein